MIFLNLWNSFDAETSYMLTSGQIFLRLPSYPILLFISSEVTVFLKWGGVVLTSMFLLLYYM